MALYFIKEEDVAEIYRKNNNVIYFEDTNSIQTKFCSIMEYTSDSNSKEFFENPKIKNYLEFLDMEYDDNYKLGTKHWCSSEHSSDEIEWEFVTYLAFWIQAAMIMLWNESSTFISETTSALDLVYSPYVLKDRDLYVINKDLYDAYSIIDYIKAGVTVWVDGHCSDDYEPDEFLGLLLDIEHYHKHISKDLDAKVFPKDFKGDFSPYTTTLKELFKKENVDEIFSQNEIPDITVCMNSEIPQFGNCRRYPLYRILECGEAIYFELENSCKWPETWVMLGEVSYYLNDTNNQKIKNASRIITLVLDGNEYCGVSRYWEKAAMVTIYDRNTKTLEICRKNDGIKLFHELLQKSEDVE